MPVLQTEVGIRLALSISRLPQATQSFKAIWDTGCTMTSISPSVATKLGLKPISMVTVCAAETTYESPVYKVDIILPNAVGVLDINVSQAKNIQGADLLIGMDIINMGDMAVTNANATTCFSFRFPPAVEHIDYVKDAQATAQRNAQEDNQVHNRQNLIKNLKRKGKLR